MMCLAVPARIIECETDDALVDMQGNRVWVSRVLTPEANIGTWVLVHAGFAISTIDEKEAATTWDYLRQSYGPGLAREMDSEFGTTADSS